MKIAFTAGNKQDNIIPIIPQLVPLYTKLDIDVFIEKDLGTQLGWQSEQFVGANIINDFINNLSNFDIIVTSNILPNDVILNKNLTVIGTLSPYQNYEKLKLFASTGANIISLDMITRSTKAQYMDILSSQASLAGYKAVIFAANEIDKTIPMLITSAGTLPSAKFLIIGAGVAGLQAIATAKRLGAKVSAFDVRSAACEQVESLGAKFIKVDEKINDVYAQETSEAYKQLQAKKLIEILGDQDVVITTAQIPGKAAPKIITKEMLKVMKSNAIIIDLASKTGGNCENCCEDTPKIFKFDNILNFMPRTASSLYSKNIYEFIKYYKEHNDSDDIIKSVIIAKDNKIVHEKLFGREERI